MNSNNMNNNGFFQGRLTANPKFWECSNSNGKMVSIKLACRRNFVPNGREISDFIEFHSFVSNKGSGNGVYDFLSVGDLVQLNYELRSSIGEKDGKTVFYQSPFITQLQIAEPKSVREERRKSKTAETKRKKA